ncbi:MAG: hypothetical protein AAF658_03720, partial [Myxococcota bacterium]
EDSIREEIQRLQALVPLTGQVDLAPGLLARIAFLCAQLGDARCATTYLNLEANAHPEAGRFVRWWKETR